MLDAESFESEVLASKEFWIVEFYAPWCGHCKKLAPEYSKAAKSLKGDARLGAVDCDVEKEIAQKYGVTGFPTIKVFKEGGEGKAETYDGPRTAEGIIEFVKGDAGTANPYSKLIPTLKYLETYNFLYLAPNDKLPKVILFSSGEKDTPSWFANLAVKYKTGKTKTVAFAQAREEDDGAKIAKNFGVTFPSLVICQINGPGDGYFLTMALEEKHSATVKAAKELIDTLGSAAEDASPMPAFPMPDVPRKKADATFFHLTEDNIDQKCLSGSKKSICIVALVAAAGDEFVERESLVELSMKFRNDPIAFSWVDASTQGDFVNAFGGLEFKGQPILAAIKTGKKKRFALLEEEFNDGWSASINSFLDKILGGDMSFKPLKTVPELVPSYMQDMFDE